MLWVSRDVVCCTGDPLIARAGKAWNARRGKRVNDETDYEAHLNRSLDDVFELLQREIARLKESLETYRLSSHPNRTEIIRWHIRTLDERQDALEQLQEMILAEQRGSGKGDQLH